ncbi:hypothetical protein C7S16_5728 [Burkholderia thailandensis]|uniref:Uncharacterized protein n=1 Tax=Burkholderia thailandensis TaxID=57975 RepID=A0AAW9CQ65_BURTH|nr:hypothetical protein [Burkholderia thailandensis]MDW9250952.1 hypothetical protein [Burkholderia thailandensis]
MVDFDRDAATPAQLCLEGSKIGDEILKFRPRTSNICMSLLY